MPIASDIVGSWFPSGYYGHFRNKARADFINEYRQLARPQPPAKFLNRAIQSSSKHVFSVHDNRNSFMSDALYFEQGLGKKRNPGKSYNYNPDFVTWMPIKDDIQRNRPPKTTYQVDFTKNGVKQLLVKRPATSFDGDPTTTYRYTHCDVGPNTQEIAQVSRKAVELTSITRLQRAKTATPPRRETVASCLSWYRPPVPAATALTDYSNGAVSYQHVPVPPATAPPALQRPVEIPLPQPLQITLQFGAE